MIRVELIAVMNGFALIQTKHEFCLIVEGIELE